jgi:hypothetical protein
MCTVRRRPASRKELLLGGGEDLFVGAAVEGELVPALAHEHGAPGAPLFYRAEDDQLLSALFAHKDDLLRRRTLHMN